MKLACLEHKLTLIILNDYLEKLDLLFLNSANKLRLKHHLKLH